MTQLQALVVDDEEHSRRRLKRMLLATQRVVVTAEAANGHEVLALLETQSFDVIFLDICMPGLDGMALASQHGHLPPIVFVTAHNEYAVQAFEAAAVDYLLKPVAEERLMQAVERLHNRTSAPANPALLDMMRSLLTEHYDGAIMPVISQDGPVSRVFDPREICRFSAADKYVMFLHDGREMILDESLLTLQSRLPKQQFLRVHRCEIVNLRKIRAVHRDGLSFTLELNDGQRVAVSRRFAPQVREKLGLRR